MGCCRARLRMTFRNMMTQDSDNRTPILCWRSLARSLPVIIFAVNLFDPYYTTSVLPLRHGRTAISTHAQRCTEPTAHPLSVHHKMKYPFASAFSKSSSVLLARLGAAPCSRKLEPRLG
jgi:hypothetical protein